MERTASDYGSSPRALVALAGAPRFSKILLEESEAAWRDIFVGNIFLMLQHVI